MDNVEAGKVVRIPADAALPYSADLERSAIARTMWHVLPLLVVCYFFAYLNRVNVSYAALQMNQSLGLTSADYGFGAGLFFVTYCLCEIPSNLLLVRFGTTRWIARIVASMGIIAVATAFIQGPTSFYAMRLLLGAAEAGFYPGILFFLTVWFPAAYRARIMGYFIASIPISGIIGAPISGRLLGLGSAGSLQGWQWLFLLEGAPTLVLAPLVLWWLQDRPTQAQWLPPAERAWLVGRLDSERSDVEHKRVFTVLQCLTNPRVLFLAAIYFSNVCLLNSITFFLPQIVKGFGLSNTQTGLVVAIPSLLALFALILWGRRSDRRKERYGHAAFANLVGGAALFGSVLTHDPLLRIALIAVAFAFTLAFTAPFWSIPGTFLTGSAAAGGIGAISALGVTGGFLSPWFIGVMKDATGDLRMGLGAIALLAMTFATALYLRRPRA